MNVQSEKKESPHPERAAALHCPPTGLLLSVWCVSVESKGIALSGCPPLDFMELTHLMAAVIEMRMRTPGKRKLI